MSGLFALMSVIRAPHMFQCAIGYAGVYDLGNHFSATPGTDKAKLDATHKPYEWMAVDGEGHGFYTEKHRAEFLTRMQAFLEKYIGPGAPMQPQE